MKKQIKNEESYQTIKDSVYQAVDSLDCNFYRNIFSDAFLSSPVYTVQFMLSLLTVTPTQKKLYGINDVKKSKIDFLKNLVIYLNKNMKHQEEDVQKEVKIFIEKVEKRLAKLAPAPTTDPTPTTPTPSPDPVQTTPTAPAPTAPTPATAPTAPDQKAEVENLPFEKTPEGIELLKEFAKDLNNNDVLDQIRKKLHNPYYPAFLIINMAKQYVVKEKPKQVAQFDETPENIELLKKFAQICIDYTHKNVWGASKKQDEMLELLKGKWNLSCNEIFKLSNPYYDQLVDEYKKEKEKEKEEKEEKEKQRLAMLIKCNEVRKLNFIISLLIKDKQKLQRLLVDSYEADYLEFEEKQMKIQAYKVDSNKAQELIDNILSFRNKGYIPTWYEYDNEDEKQIAIESWTNFLNTDVYDLTKKEDIISNLTLLFSKIRK